MASVLPIDVKRQMAYFIGYGRCWTDELTRIFPSWTSRVRNLVARSLFSVDAATVHRNGVRDRLVTGDGSADGHQQFRLPCDLRTIALLHPRRFLDLAVTLNEADLAYLEASAIVVGLDQLRPDPSMAQREPD